MIIFDVNGLLLFYSLKFVMQISKGILLGILLFLFNLEKLKTL